MMNLVKAGTGQAFYCDHLDMDRGLEFQEYWAVSIEANQKERTCQVLYFCPICAAVVRDAVHQYYEELRARANRHFGNA